MKNRLVDQVCGRINEGPDEIPEPTRQSRLTYDEETNQLPSDGTMPDESVVDGLVSQWQNGQRSEVAAQILFSSVSYADFAKFVYKIGQEEAIQLGLMLDNMSETEGTGGEKHNDIISSVTGVPRSATPPVEEPGIPPGH